MRKKSLGIFFAVTAILSLCPAGTIQAQEKFPTRPIQFIIPWAAGGGGTINAQALQPTFEKVVSGSVQIVNKPGGAGTIASGGSSTDMHPARRRRTTPPLPCAEPKTLGSVLNGDVLDTCILARHGRPRTRPGWRAYNNDP